MMNKWGVLYACVLILIQWVYIKIKECYQFQYEAVKAEKIEYLKKNIMFYAEDLGIFSNDKDLAELQTAMGKGVFDRNLLHNSGKQKILNESKRNKILKLMRWLDKNRITIVQFFKKFTWKDIITVSFYVFLPFVIWGTSYIDKLSAFYGVLFGELLSIDNICLELYLAQLSLTFITISVMSIFSDGNVVIYWQNVVKQMLIEPVARCFKAYFGYSFFYLLGSTVFLMLGNDKGLAILFFFNIVCLFDLSRIMINCYYGQKAKQERLIKDFIKKIEKANIAVFWILKKPENENQERQNYLDEVIDTFDTFNYYTTDAYDNRKYTTVKENLVAYGKLLAYVNSAMKEMVQFPLIEWYDKKTYKYYRNVVKKYYTEYYSLIFGNDYSNTNAPRNGIEIGIIHQIIYKLSNDIHNHLEVNNCYELVLYKFLVIIYLAARSEDGDNLEKYKIEIKDCYDGNWLYRNVKRIGEKFENLLKFYNEDIPELPVLNPDDEKNKTSEEQLQEKAHRYRKQLQEKLHRSVVELMGDVVLFNTNDYSCLRFLWMPINELNNIDKILDEVKVYVEDKCKKLSKHRQFMCKKRLTVLERNINKIRGEISGTKIDKAE